MSFFDGFHIGFRRCGWFSFLFLNLVSRMLIMIGIKITWYAIKIHAMQLHIISTKILHIMEICQLQWREYEHTQTQNYA